MDLWKCCRNDFIIRFTIRESDLTWDEDLYPPTDPRIKTSLVGFFSRQSRRLERLRNIQYRDGNPGMPQHEWNTAWKYQQVNIQAIALAIESLEKGIEVRSKANVTAIGPLPHYDPLGEEPDELMYSEETCDNGYDLLHLDHKVVESQETYYQDLRFLIQPDSKDVVMEMDGTTQIASVDRPQYHEYSVHCPLFGFRETGRFCWRWRLDAATRITEISRN